MLQFSHEAISQEVYNTLTNASRQLAVSAAIKDADILKSAEDVAQWLSHYKRLGYKTFVPALYTRFNLGTTARKSDNAPAPTNPDISQDAYFDGIVAAMARAGMVQPVAVTAPARKSTARK